ncbi:MAG: glycosyltransferase family 2 protein [Candidatus Kerfeldbacteria bacterium]|nr:glycosyltransferase family 2 protein [Candidatus Kerfeldbacteria bacterium]
MAKVAVLILNWNGWQWTEQAIRSVQASRDATLDIVVLDNGSITNEAVVLKKIFPAITIERSETNLGFAGGNNYLFKKLLPDNHYDFFLLLNQDATVDPACIARLVAYSQNQPRVAVVGPTVYQSNSRVIQSVGADINFFTGKVISRYRGDTTPPAQPAVVASVIGNCWLVRTAALQALGYFDDRYFAYYEEVAWCVRANRAGWQCVAIPAASAYHAKAGGFRTYWNVRNMIWFERQYASGWQRFYFRIYFWVKFFPERLVKGSPWKELWRASRDGWLTTLS